MMKRIVTMLFFFSLILLAVGLVAPSLIDWNRHKDEIVERLSFYLQRKIEVGGDISLQVIPQPEMMLESVTVENVAGGKSGPFMTLRQLGVRIKFAPLLQGRVEVESLDLINPVINLEILENGKANWPDVLKEKSADAFSSAAAEVSLNQVRVADGTLNYTNQATGSRLKIEGLNLFITADTLLGPYLVTGDIKYRHLPVNIEVKTEKYDGISSLPVEFFFLPSSRMPQLRLNGVIDFKSGIDVQGEMTAGHGDLGSLFDAGSFSNIGFMHDDADLRGVLELKGDQFSLSDIKAKFGQKGELQGKMSVQFFRDRKPFVHLDAEGSNLVLTDRSSDVYMEAPGGFAGGIRFKGKNVVWGGNKLGAVEIAADFSQKEWKIKSAQIDLSPGTQIKLTGVAVPSSDSAAYMIQLTTGDLGKLAGALAPAEGSAFKFLSDTGIVRKFALSSSLDVSPSRISFFNMDAAIEDKMKLSGVLNIDRTSQKPNFVAKLNLTGLDTASFPAQAYDGFLQKLMQSDADIELTMQNLTKNGVKMPEVYLKGVSKGQGLDIQDLHGSLPGQGSFSLSGHVASLHPASGVDVAYTLKAEQAQDIAKVLKISLPAPLSALKNPDIKGGIKGGAPNYTFSVEGSVENGGVQLSGAVEPDAQGNDVYQMDFHLQHKNAGDVLSSLGVPIGKLMGDEGAFDFSGALKSAGDDYRIDKIQARIGASKSSGSLEKKGGKYTADLIVGKLDLDQWLEGEWPVTHDISLALRGDDLSWKGLHIAQPQLTIEADAASVKIADLQGKVWGGDLKADLALTRQPSSAWSSSFKGSLKQADLNMLNTRLGFHGFSTWTGDIDFDLNSAKNTLETATGVIDVAASTLTIEKFSFDKLGDLISQWTAVPPALQQLVDASFHSNGATTFKAVRGKFKVNQGKLSIESLNLSNAYGAMEVSGSADMKAGAYDISGDLLLKQPPGVQAIKVRRTPGATDYTVDSKPIGEFVVRNNPVPIEVQPVPDAAEASPPAQNEDGGVVGDILKRLDEEDSGSQKKP
ncbi:MAG: AsmA family protein [Alphaproteobacteria bacterium]|nr:AsmA family protein [Alphaproteobacteria bacterium]